MSHILLPLPSFMDKSYSLFDNITLFFFTKKGKLYSFIRFLPGFADDDDATVFFGPARNFILKMHVDKNIFPQIQIVIDGYLMMI